MSSAEGWRPSFCSGDNSRLAEPCLNKGWNKSALAPGWNLGCSLVDKVVGSRKKRLELHHK